MLSRCNDPANKSYAEYGGRGIKVCDRWAKFENFLADMGEPPAGLSLDRIGNNGGYSKRNCRWATPREQTLNSRQARMLEHNGRVMCMSDWAAHVGVSRSTMCLRIKRLGWPGALTNARKYTKKDKAHWS